MSSSSLGSTCGRPVSMATTPKVFPGPRWSWQWWSKGRFLTCSSWMYQKMIRGCICVESRSLRSKRIDHYYKWCVVKMCPSASNKNFPVKWDTLCKCLYLGLCSNGKHRGAAAPLTHLCTSSRHLFTTRQNTAAHSSLSTRGQNFPYVKSDANLLRFTSELHRSLVNDQLQYPFIKSHCWQIL